MYRGRRARTASTLEDLTTLRLRSTAVRDEAEQMIGHLALHLADLYSTVELSKDLCQPPLFVEPFCPAWLPVTLNHESIARHDAWIRRQTNAGFAEGMTSSAMTR